MKVFAPAAVQSHKTETRIPAIAHFVLQCKREKKALRLFPFRAVHRVRKRRQEKKALRSLRFGHCAWFEDGTGI